MTSELNFDNRILGLKEVKYSGKLSIDEFNAPTSVKINFFCLSAISSLDVLLI